MTAQSMTTVSRASPGGRSFREQRESAVTRWTCREHLNPQVVRGCVDQDPALGWLTDRHALWPLPLPGSDINLLLQMERWLSKETVSLPNPGYPAEQRQDSDPGLS